MERTRKLATRLCLAGFGIAAASAAMAQTTTLRVASYAPPGNFVNVDLISGFLDRVVADSEGTLAYQLFEGGTLGRAPAEQLRLVQQGVADMALVLPSFTPGAYDLYGVVEIPGLFADAREASMVLERAHEAGLVVDPEGTRLMCIMTTDINIIGLGQPIADLDELEGLRLRVVGRPQAAATELLGAVPTTGITSPEVAEAASRGTIDGEVMGAGAIVAYRVMEVNNHYVRLPIGMNTLYLPINENTWNSLPAPAKASFERHGGAACADFAGSIFRDTDAMFYDQIVSMEGRTETVVDDAMLAGFLELVAPVGEEWAARGDDFRAVYDFAVQARDELRAE